MKDLPPAKSLERGSVRPFWDGSADESYPTRLNAELHVVAAERGGTGRAPARGEGVHHDAVVVGVGDGAARGGGYDTAGGTGAA